MPIMVSTMSPNMCKLCPRSIQEGEDLSKSAVGYLVWISTARTGGQKPDVIRYAEVNPEFPSVSTLDQLFSQSQFESYRQLGYAAAGDAFEDEIDRVGGDGQTIDREGLETVFRNLWAREVRRISEGVA